MFAEGLRVEELCVEGSRVEEYVCILWENAWMASEMILCFGSCGGRLAWHGTGQCIK